MKTLGEILTPRKTVVDQSYKDVVLNLTDLDEDKIDPDRFFAENYNHQRHGATIPERFQVHGRHYGWGLQTHTSMGGGKAYTMIAVGLRAKYPEYPGYFEAPYPKNQRHQALGEGCGGG